jgi:hypothetical protein
VISLASSVCVAHRDAEAFIMTLTSYSSPLLGSTSLGGKHKKNFVPLSLEVAPNTKLIKVLLIKFCYIHF